MKTLKAIVLPLLCVTSAQYTSSQSNHVNGFSGIPLWPFDGQVRPEYASHAVFRDIQTGDLIVSYLPMSISVDQSSMSDRKTFRIILPNRSRPRLGVSVRLLSDGYYEYRYSISNLGNNVAPITSWALELSSREETEVTEPVPWQHEEHTSIPGAEKGYSILRGFHDVTWSMPKASPEAAEPSGIASNSRPVIFVVKSKNSPGFTVARFKSGEVMRQSQEKLPETVEAEVKKWTDDAHSSRWIWVIGPKYPPSIPKIERINGIQTDIAILHGYQLLDSESPFVKEAQSTLGQILPGLQSN